MGGEVRLETPVTKIEVVDGDVVAVHTADEVIEPRGVISSLPLRATVGIVDPPPPADGPRGGPGPALPRLPDGRADPRRRGPLPGQLDLHPRAGRPGRPHPELPLLEPVDGPGPGHRLRRPGVLLLQGRRPLDDGRRGPRRAGHARARGARPRAGPSRSRRGYVVRVPMAYPMYDEDYAERVEAIRGWLDPLAEPRCRSAATGCTATTTPTTRCSARCAPSTTSMAGTAHDIWAVNVEPAYHEDRRRRRAALPQPEPPAMREPLGEAASSWAGRAILALQARRLSIVALAAWSGGSPAAMPKLPSSARRSGRSRRLALYAVATLLRGERWHGCCASAGASRAPTPTR